MTYAFEHTAVEPFAGQIQNNANFATQFMPITAALTPHVPPNEQWELTIAESAMVGMSVAAIGKLHTELVAFLLRTAPSVPVLPWGDLSNWGSVLNSSAGSPLRVRFRRMELREGYSGPLQGAHITRSVPTLDELRTKRMEKVCATKFPKLQAWRERGARTILVLDSDDMILSNIQDVAKAYLAAEAGAPNRPDEVYFVWVWPDLASWYMAALRIDDRDHAALWKEHENQYELAPAILDDLTA